MTPEPAPRYGDQIGAFQRRHRTVLFTLVFTDIVGSTALKQLLGDQRSAELFQKHHQIVRNALKEFPDGEEIETAGDSFLLVFATPSAAVQFALLLQARLRNIQDPATAACVDRIGIHMGEVVLDAGPESTKSRNIFGLPIDMGARVMGLASAGQILMTRPVFDNARQSLRGEDIPGLGPLAWFNHGPYLIKGLDEPLEICEVGEAALGSYKAPADAQKAQRKVSADEEPVLGWRPALGQVVPNTQWVLENKLGEGGFGEVWLGRHQKLKERRVFKFCFRADRVRSLKREMTLFRVLKERVGDHPNIVRLLDVYFDEPPFYVVMDHVEGQDLKCWCEKQGGAEKIPLAARLEIVAQIADALQAAHEAGVIHRDVKPANILISPGVPPSGGSAQESQARSGLGRMGPAEGGVPNEPGTHTPAWIRVQAKLTDFGIGQVVSAEVLKGVTKAGFTQTILADFSSSSQTGSQMYVAPELLAGKPASTRSDIYSLGVVLYQVLVGDLTRPLTTDWADSIADPLLRDDLKHCFAGNPQDRFAGAGQLATNLRALSKRRATLEQQRAELAARERAAYRRGVVLAASLAAVIVALVTGLAIVALQQSRKAKATALRESHERQRAEKEKVEARRFLYVANLNLAQEAWEQSNISRLRQLLEETQESPDRGFEWYYWQWKTHQALKTLQGHLGPVRSVAFSPDGQRIVTGSDDQTAKVWDTTSGRVLRKLNGHRKEILSVAFSPDGQRIVTGSSDQTAKVWEAATGLELRTLKGHSALIRSVAFSPDGQRIVTGSEDHTAKVWDAASGTNLLTLDRHTKQIRSVAFSPDGQRIVTGSDDQTAKVWDAATGLELRTLKGHGRLITSVGFSADSQRIVTGSEDHTAKVWDAANGTNLLTLDRHTNQIRSVAFSPDSQRIVTGSEDPIPKVWDAATGLYLRTLKGHVDRISSVAFSPDSQRIVTGSFDHTAKLWNAAGDWELLTLKGHRDQIVSVAFSLDGQRIVTGSLDRTARVWEAANGRPLLALKGHTGWIRSAAFSPDGRRIVTGSMDQTAKVWDTANGTDLITLTGHRSWISSVAFSPDGQRIVTGSLDQTAKVWDAASGTNLLTLEGHTKQIRSVAFSLDGQRIVTGSMDQTAKVWDAASGTNLLTLRGHSSGINSVAFSPDGQRIITGSDDWTAKAWDLASHREMFSLKGHTAPIGSVAFSPDGQRIVTGSEDHAAKLWEAASGRELLTLKGHSAPIGSVAFSPDGQRIVTGSQDWTAKVWRAARAEQVAAWQKEERTAAQYLAALQRERTTEQERQQIARASDEGAIKRWLILAPIALAIGESEAEGLDLEQIESEGQLRPKVGKGTVMVSGELKWQEVAQEDYVIDFNAILGHVVGRSVAYAVCYFRSEAEQSGLEMLVGSSDQAKVYLNGKQTYKYPFPRSFILDQDRVQDIAMHAGVNVLVFKVVNQSGDWKGSIRFTDAQGNPVKGIQVTLTP